jgi:hypothetical protein
MKATIEIPDELYRQVKAKSALEGRAIREVTIELYQVWLKQEPPLLDERSPEQLMEDLFKLADQLMAGAPPGPTARELLEEDRNRLEKSS